jgi:hypothetical protein
VESICNDPEILERNYNMKLRNKDYKDQDPETALRDFKERVAKYEQVYEEVLDNEDGGKISYIKMYNVGQKAALFGLYSEPSGVLPHEHSHFSLQNLAQPAFGGSRSSHRSPRRRHR